MRSSKPKPVAAENRLAKALAEIASALRAANVPWMVIGGIASIALGVRRMTTDIDVVVRGDETSPAALLRALATRRIVPRIDDAEAFARERLVLLLHHEPTGVDFDLSFGWTTFEHEALEARSDAAYGSRRRAAGRGGLSPSSNAESAARSRSDISAIVLRSDARSSSSRS